MGRKNDFTYLPVPNAVNLLAANPALQNNIFQLRGSQVIMDGERAYPEIYTTDWWLNEEVRPSQFSIQRTEGS